jgi:tRNA dimethylallyltransferase
VARETAPRRQAADVIAIFGPTGVGKTAVAIALARQLRAGGEDPVAISADALQVYAGLEALTGAPTERERRLLEHELVGFVPVAQSFSVGEYAPRAHAAIDAALASGRRPLVVGGTGLYLRAALADLELSPRPRPGLREQLEERLRTEGLAALHAELARRSPRRATAIAPTDRTRVIRALETVEMGERDAELAERDELWSGRTRHPTALAGLVMDRARLYERIDARVEAIVAAGAIEEVRRAELAGASPTARKALGYAELLEGDVEAMKRRTRNFAKRQLTWMRKLPNVEVIDMTDRDPGDVAREVARRAPRPS